MQLLKRTGFPVVLALAALALPSSALALPAAGISGGSVVTFDTADPGTTIESHPVTGLAAGYSPAEIDVRPSNGRLYLVARSSSGTSLELYILDPGTGAATEVGSSPFTTGVGSTAAVGADFSPATGRLRVITSSGSNLLVNPDTGAIVTPSEPAVTPSGHSIASIAYSGDASAGHLYGWDYPRNRVVRLTGTNENTVVDLGPSGVSDGTQNTGFDVAADGSTYLSTGPGDALYAVDLATGALTPAGNLAPGVVDFALLPVTPFDFGNGSFAVAKSAGKAIVTVQRPTAIGTMTVHYSTADDSANAADYTPTSGTLTFAPGVALQSFDVPITNDPATEPPETLKLALSAPTGGATLGSVSTAKLTIFDDTPPAIDRIAPVGLIALDSDRVRYRTLVRGLRGAFSCSKACRATFTLKQGRIVIGAGFSKLSKAGRGRFRVNVSRGGKKLLVRYLKRHRSVRVRLLVNTADQARNAQVTGKTFTVTR